MDMVVKMPNRRKKFARSHGHLDLSREDDEDGPIQCPISHHCTAKVIEPYSKETQILFDRIGLMKNEFKEGLVEQSAVVKAKDLYRAFLI